MMLLGSMTIFAQFATVAIILQADDPAEYPGVVPEAAGQVMPESCA
jgi:hypothetical protein